MRGSRRRFDDATEREIYDAYRTGEYLFKDLADKYGCSITTVFHIVSTHDAKNGVITPRHKSSPKPAPKLFDHDTERVIYAAYRDGETSTSLAAKYDCNPGTVMNIVNRCDAENSVKTPRHFNGRGGGKLLERGRLSYKMSNRQAIEMYVARRNGATFRTLAERYCVSITCVRTVYKRVEEAARQQGLKV